MSALEWIGLVSGIASLVLSVLAIWLSLYFFQTGKATEQRVATSQAKIESEVRSLEALTGRWMDRFTRHATRDPKPDAIALTLIERLDPRFLLNQQQLVSELGKETLQAKQDGLDWALVAMHYAAVANVHLAWDLPSPDRYEPSNQMHMTVVQLTDNSYNDYVMLRDQVAALGADLISKSKMLAFYNSAQNFWEPLMRTSIERFAELARQASVQHPSGDTDQEGT